jgi:hypothetical protein
MPVLSNAACTLANGIAEVAVFVLVSLPVPVALYDEVPVN